MCGGGGAAAWRKERRYLLGWSNDMVEIGRIRVREERDGKENRAKEGLKKVEETKEAKQL